MYLSFDQIIELLDSTKGSNSIFDLLIPLFSALLGGILSLLTTIVLLNKQYKNKQKEMEHEEDIRKKEKDILDLKDYYIHFSNYFLGIHNHYYAFPLVINGEMTYEDWFSNKFERKPYDHTQIELLTSLFNLDDEIDDFYKVNDKLNELYLITDLSSYKKGMTVQLDTSQFDDLFNELKTEGLKFKNRIVEIIKEKEQDLNRDDGK